MVPGTAIFTPIAFLADKDIAEFWLVRFTIFSIRSWDTLDIRTIKRQKQDILHISSSKQMGGSLNFMQSPPPVHFPFCDDVCWSSKMRE